MQGIATACALGSGVGMALVNLVFGQFITLITDYTSGRSDPARFRSEAGRLRYVPCVQSRSAEETNIKIVSTFLSLAFADSFSLMDTAHCLHLPHTGSREIFAACT
jgi:hypothetical protein